MDKTKLEFLIMSSKTKKQVHEKYSAITGLTRSNMMVYVRRYGLTPAFNKLAQQKKPKSGISKQELLDTLNKDTNARNLTEFAKAEKLNLATLLNRVRHYGLNVEYEQLLLKIKMNRYKDNNNE